LVTAMNGTPSGTQSSGSHGLAGAGRPGHRVDFHRRIVDWIDRHAGQACDDGGRDRAHETHDANAAAS